MKRVRSIVCALAAMAALSAPAAAGDAPAPVPATPSDPAAIFQRANEAFERGASLRETDRAKADAALTEAIHAYTELIDDKGINNPKLYYDLGNAYMMRGDTPEAIVAYRRAMRLDPQDPNLRGNLAYARSRVETAFKTDETSRFFSALGAWQNIVPIRVRLAIFVGLFGMAWVVGFVRLSARGRRAIPRWAMVLLLALSVLPAASLAVTAAQRSTKQGVVVASVATGRKGPDKSYEPSFTSDLSGGVEFTLLETRPGWVYVRLPDGRTTWLASDAVEMI